VPNGDFECGLAAWTTHVPDTAASVAVTSPGNTGSKAFQVTFQAPAVSPDHGLNARVISAAIRVTPGTTYLLSYATWFDNINAGLVGPWINDKTYRTVDSTDYGAGVWHVNQQAWTPDADVTSAVLKFDFVFGGNVNSIAKIDSVAFVPLASCDDAPGPGILPNGDFECGLGSWTVQTPDKAATTAVTATGAYMGYKAFEVDFTSPSVSTDHGVSARIFSKQVSVTPGKEYELDFYAYFSPGSAGFIGVMINNVAIMTRDAHDNPAQGIYYENKVRWTAPAGVTTASVKFEFIFSATSVNRLDAVTLNAVA
jgi:hypothetical protein